MADPLKLLREFALDGRPIRERDGLIVLGDVGFRKDVNTNFKIWRKQNEYYSLESLYYFFLKKDMPHTAYVKEAAAAGIQPVTRPDRKGVLDYLSERDAKAPSSIDVTAPVAVPQHMGRQKESDSAPSEPKRARPRDRSPSQRERVERILGGSPELDAQTGSVRALSDEFTAERIAALRNKRRTLKRTQIKPTEDADVGAAGGDLDDTDVEQRCRERCWRSRTTCLEAATRNFHKSVYPLLQTLKARDEAASRGSRPATKPDAAADPTAPKQRASQNTGYSRYDQERFRKEEMAGFNIDTGGTYHGITLKSITEGAKPPATGGGGGGAAEAAAAAVAAQTADVAKGRRRVSRTPIIVVPASTAALVNMYNVRELLQELRFVSAEDKRQSGARRDNEVLVQRRKEGGVTVPWRVVDNPLKLTADEWDRVVAVFVQGPAWQFKGWPHGGVPVDIFSRVAAFHLKWDEDKLDANVAKWNVHVLSLSKTKRHLDKANLPKFWNILDKFLLKNKPYLRF